ncbi:hypothetical protein [Bacillus paramycoides]|uniref:hypothetical protein n=1 Tax=Bacillus paramycoides TaxID=2026194 RepID=UPI002E1D29D5|nr:hypothetical protein [Bacillus paramycoides]
MYYYYVPQVYSYPTYYPVHDMRRQFGVYQQPQQQNTQERKPYLMTWPYSNVYYGNYYES